MNRMQSEGDNDAVVSGQNSDHNHAFGRVLKRNGLASFSIDHRTRDSTGSGCRPELVVGDTRNDSKMSTTLDSRSITLANSAHPSIALLHFRLPAQGVAE